MKIIDLLNKIAKGEEVPKQIKYCGVNYYWTGFNYENSEASEVLFWACIYSEKYINDEVEILDEEQEDKKIETINSFTSNVGAVDGDNIEEYIHKLFEQELILYFKINEIIDYINKGKNNVSTIY